MQNVDKKTYNLVKRSRLVNARWYEETYQDVKNLEMDAISHYLKYGWVLGRNPCKRFDTKFYLSQYKELMSENENPLVHYLTKGRLLDGVQIREGAPTEQEERIKTHVVEHLWGGYSTHALKSLQIIYSNEEKDFRVRSFAAWHAARWYYFVDDFTNALRLAHLIREIDSQASLSKRVVMLFAFCYLGLGDNDSARQELSLFLEAFPDDTDALLAISNCVSNKLDYINAVYRKSGFLEIETRDKSKSIGLDNVRGKVGSDYIKSNKKVSVIMPIYNAEDKIDIAIQGLLDQTWRNIEIIAVDDRSSDCTYQKLLEWSRLDDRVIPYRQPQNAGAYAARNAGLKMAAGDYITTHDSDDWSHPQKIETQVRYLEANRSVVGVIAFWVRATSDLQFTQNWRLNTELVHWSHSSFLFRREVVSKLGGWDEVLVGGDTEFIWRVERVYGTKAVKKIKKSTPFSFALDDESSLTRTKSTHVKSIHYGLRHIYRSICKWWHASNSRDLSMITSTRPFPAPRPMYERSATALEFDVVVAGNFSDKSQCEIALEYCLSRKEMRIAIFHWPSFIKPVTDLKGPYFQCVLLGHVEPVVMGQRVKAECYLIADESLMDYPLDDQPDWQDFNGWIPIPL